MYILKPDFLNFNIRCTFNFEVIKKKNEINMLYLNLKYLLFIPLSEVMLFLKYL